MFQTVLLLLTDSSSDGTQLVPGSVNIQQISRAFPSAHRLNESFRDTIVRGRCSCPDSEGGMYNKRRGFRSKFPPCPADRFCPLFQKILATLLIYVHIFNNSISLSDPHVAVADPGGDPREQRNPPFAQNIRIDI